MFIDARQLPNDHQIHSDICIIGAGAAGITLSLKFLDQKYKVCLLESGGLDLDPKTQSLYNGENIGLPYPLNETRLRYFGGTTNHWGGQCQTLAKIDFKNRDWIPDSGWPFGKPELDVYYKEASSICELESCDFESSSLTKSEQKLLLPFDDNYIQTKIFRFSPPTRFGQIYRNKIKNSSNITTYLYANTLQIKVNEDANHVTQLQLGSLNGNLFRVISKIYILATGAIENARLLLLSNNIQKEGLGNCYGNVGRYFTEHTGWQGGILTPSNSQLDFSFYTSFYRKRKTWGNLVVSEKSQYQEKLLNAGISIWPIEALKQKVAREIFIKHQWPNNLGKHLINIFSDIEIEVGNLPSGRRKSIHPYLIGCLQEQIPYRESRVKLCQQLDLLGQRKLQLDWHSHPMEKHAIQRTIEFIAKEFGASGFGRIQIDVLDSHPSISYHHIGTTRMHTDLKKGIVNENCQIHGISNLFIAGSSVFPTSGIANPTLTIVALAIRLAEHLKKILNR